MIKADLRLSNTQLGLAFSAFAIPYALFQLIGGWIGDKLGTTADAVGLLRHGGRLHHADGRGHRIRVAVRLASGCWDSPKARPSRRPRARWPVGRRLGNWGFAQGITHSFARIGNAVTPPLMAALLLFSSWRRSFVMLGSASLLWLVVWAWYFRNDPREHPAMTAADLADAPGRARQPARQSRGCGSRGASCP